MILELDMDFQMHMKQSLNAIIWTHIQISIDTANKSMKRFEEVTEIHRRGGFSIFNYICSLKRLVYQVPNEVKAKIANAGFTVWNGNKSNKYLSVIDGTVRPTINDKLYNLLGPIYDPIWILIQKIWKSEIDWDDNRNERN